MPGPSESYAPTTRPRAALLSSNKSVTPGESQRRQSSVVRSSSRSYVEQNASGASVSAASLSCRRVGSSPSAVR